MLDLILDLDPLESFKKSNSKLFDLLVRLWDL